MPGRLRRLATIALLAPLPLLGQVVRGRLTERASGAPLSGVVVEAFPDSGDQRVGAALSTPDGGYAIRLPGPGRYVLTAKRIGVRRVRTATFTVGAGESVVRDLEIEALLYTLPEVVVTGLATCTGRRDNALRLASLWEEARTALFASELSLRDERFRAHVTRYVRELEPENGRIVAETRSEMAGVVSRPFTSVDPESLSVRGYWWTEADGSVTYYGPDADVLLSDAFVRDHCFYETSRRDRRGLVGLGFRPVPERTLADVVGTLWLDARTFELRHVEFTYSRSIANARSSLVGGEVHFARLPSGAWIVRRWFIRLPVTARPTSPLAVRQVTAPWVLVRPVNLPLREEGGEVAAEELVRASTMMSISGVVRDSANRPWEGATLRVAGTRLTAISRASGAFTIDSVPAGNWTVLAEEPGYDSLGIAAAESRVEVSPGRAARVNLRALNGRGALTRMCPGRPVVRGQGALRVTVRGADDASLVTNLPLQVSWTPVGRGGRAGTPVFLQRSTDDTGRLTVCDAPSGPEITVILARLEGGATEPVRLVVPDRGARAVVLRVER